MTEATVVWEGADSLRDVLRPVEELRIHPENPWVGDVAEIARSLKRWGQIRPVLVDPEGTIVAGNHTTMAARELGWTHIAAIPNDFASADEARAYLLADNRIPELGDYERAELVSLLAELEEKGRWEGTGYRPNDLDDLRALEAAKDAPPLLDPEPAERPPVPELREVVLMFTEEQRDVFGGHLATLHKEFNSEGVTEAVTRALREEATRLNLGVGDAGEAV